MAWELRNGRHESPGLGIGSANHSSNNNDDTEDNKGAPLLNKGQHLSANPKLGKSLHDLQARHHSDAISIELCYQFMFHVVMQFIALAIQSQARIVNNVQVHWLIISCTCSEDGLFPVDSSISTQGTPTHD